MEKRHPKLTVRDPGAKGVSNAVEILKNTEESVIVNGTFEKTPQMEQLIKDAIAVVTDFFHSRGIEISLDGVLDKFIMIEDKEAIMRSPDGSEGALTVYATMYESIMDVFLIKKRLENNPLFAFRTIVHELMHYCQLNYTSVSRTLNDNVIMRIKGGFQTMDTFLNDDGSYDEHSIFVGLNESVTELITFLAIERTKMLRDYQLQNLWNDSYIDEKEVLVAIIQAIAENEQKSFVDTENLFINAYLDGSMMFLRRTEKYFGKNALRILSHMRTTGLETEQEQEYNRLAINFFRAKSQEDREHYANLCLKQIPNKHKDAD